MNSVDNISVIWETQKCYECNGELERVIFNNEEIVGGWVVTDNSLYCSQCKKCGMQFITAKQLSYFELRAAALVLRNFEKINGEVIRYARKALGFNKEELAKVLECEVDIVNRWESEGKISKRDQLALIALVDSERNNENILNREVLSLPGDKSCELRK